MRKSAITFRYHLLVITILFNFNQTLYAQKCKNCSVYTAVNIMFSPDGKMINFPRAVITQSSRISFTVKVPVEYLQAQQKTMQDLLAQTEKNLVDRHAAYLCFFKDRIDSFIKGLHKINEVLKNEFCQLQSIGVDNVKSDYIPVKDWFNNVLNNQFEVKIYNGSSCVQTITLTAAACKSGCVLFESPCKQLSKMLCNGCLPDKLEELDFQFIKHDPLNFTLVNWYNTVTEKLMADGKATTEAIDSVLGTAATETNCNNFQSKDLSAMEFLSTWFRNWFWLTGGDLTLDPFKNLPKSKKEAIQKRIDDYTVEINDLNEKLKFNDSVKAKLKARPHNIYMFSRLVNRGDELKKELTRITKQKTDLEEQLKNAGDNSKNLLEANTVLYLGKLALSRKFLEFKGQEFINVQKQFDASRSYSPVYYSKRELQRVTEIPENESVKILIQNLDAKAGVKLDEKIQDFNDLEEFTKLVGDELGKVDFSSVSSQTFSNLTTFFQSLTRGVAPLTFAADTVTGCGACSEFQKYLAALWGDYQKGIVSFPPEKVVSSAVTINSSPMFKSELLTIKDADAPYRDSINFKQFVDKDTTVINKTSVKVGRLRFIQLGAGVAFNRNPETQTTIDTTGGAFKVSTTDNEVAAIVGFKVYPFRSYNRDNNLLPRYPLRRLSFFGGFEIIHPLKNFFVGGAYDIVPGLAFSYGANFYQATDYAVQNGAIIKISNTYKKSGAYYSVMINPTLLVQVVKLFFTQF